MPWRRGRNRRSARKSNRRKLAPRKSSTLFRATRSSRKPRRVAKRKTSTRSRGPAVKAEVAQRVLDVLVPGPDTKPIWPYKDTGYPCVSYTLRDRIKLSPESVNESNLGKFAARIYFGFENFCWESITGQTDTVLNQTATEEGECVNIQTFRSNHCWDSNGNACSFNCQAFNTSWHEDGPYNAGELTNQHNTNKYRGPARVRMISAAVMVRYLGDSEKDGGWLRVSQVAPTADGENFTKRKMYDAGIMQDSTDTAFPEKSKTTFMGPILMNPDGDQITYENYLRKGAAIAVVPLDQTFDEWRSPNKRLVGSYPEPFSGFFF